MCSLREKRGEGCALYSSEGLLPSLLLSSAKVPSKSSLLPLSTFWRRVVVVVVVVVLVVRFFGGSTRAKRRKRKKKKKKNAFSFSRNRRHPKSYTS